MTGVAFSCCVNLLLIWYLGDSCNLILHCFGWTIYATYGVLFETKYSRMDQVKFVEDSLKADHTTSNFLKAVFHKF